MIFVRISLVIAEICDEKVLKFSVRSFNNFQSKSDEDEVAQDVLAQVLYKPNRLNYLYISGWGKND